MMIEVLYDLGLIALDETGLDFKPQPCVNQESNQR